MARLRAIPARIGAADPFRVDVALTAVVIAAWLVDASIAGTHGGDRMVTTLVGLAAFVPLARRRTYPLGVTLIFITVTLAQEGLESYFITSTTVPTIALILVMYTLGRHTEGRQLVGGAVFAFIGLSVALMLEPGPHPEDLLFVVFLLGAPLLAGRGLRNRSSLQRELREKAKALEVEGRERGRLATERERTRIATELQSVVANGVSAMVVQAEAVPRLIATHQAERAGEALATIEETGRDALIEMRRLLGVLRRGDDTAELAPQPSLRRVGALVDESSAEGLETGLHTDAEIPELSPGIDLAAYRVIERALADARASQAREAFVVIRPSDSELAIEVRDDRLPDDQVERSELAALRERLSIYDGRLSVERDPGGGVVLRASLPLGGA